MAIEVIVSVHHFPEGTLEREGVLIANRSLCSVGLDFAGGDELMMRDGTERFDMAGDLFVMPTDGTSGTRVLRQIRRKGGEEIAQYNFNAVGNERPSMCFNGREKNNILDRAGADRVQMFPLQRDISLVGTVNNDTDTADKLGIMFNGREHFLGDTAGGTTITFQEWDINTRASTQKVRDLSSGLARGRGIEFDGRSIISVRDIGTAGSLGYRVNLKDATTGETIKNVFQRTPSGATLTSVEGIAYDGHHLFVIWVTDSSGSGLPGFN